MKIVDTQIISYSFKSVKDFTVNNDLIPSIVAIEFLLMQTDNSFSANYYIPKISRFHIDMLGGLKIDHPFNKKSTDSLIFDFGQLHKPFAIFSNFNVSDLINTKNSALFDSSVSYLDKERQKDLKKKFRFLLDNDIHCEPILEDDINIGYDLLDKFIIKHNSKSDFKNTWNDILILSKAINKQLPLLTEDKLLNRFAADNYNKKAIEENGVLKIDFSDIMLIKRMTNNESKGYINRGWEYKMTRNYAP